MSRIPELALDKLSPEQRRVHDAIVAGPRGQVAAPLKVWLNNPGLADPAQALGAYCRYGTKLPPNLRELAVLIVGAHWRAGFEWAVHAPLAVEAGIDPGVVEKIRTGAAPHFEREDEQAVYEFVTELLTTRRVPPPVWDRALSILGQGDLIDIVGILGYYTLICLTIDAFEVPAPAGAKEPFDGAA